MLGTLVAHGILLLEEADSMMEAAVNATSDAGGMLALEQEELMENAKTAMLQQMQNSRQQARQLEEASAARAVQAEEAQQPLLKSEVCLLSSL